MGGAVTVGRLVFDMAADVAQLKNDMSTATAVVEAAGLTIERAANAAKGALLGLAASLGPAAFVEMISATIEATAALEKMSEKTGISVEALSALRSVAKLTGTDMDAVAQGIGKFDKAMLEAATTGGKAKDVFDALGVQFKNTDGTLRDVDATFLDFAVAMSQMERGATKTAFAQIELGKAGKELIPVLNELGTIGEYQAKVTGQQAAIAEDFERNLIRLGSQGRELRTILATELTPTLDALAIAFLNVMKNSSGLRDLLKETAADGSLAAWAQQAGFQLAVLADALVDEKNALHLFGEEVALVIIGFLDFAQAATGVAKVMTGDVQGGLKLITSAWADFDKALQVVKKDFNEPLSTKFQDAFTSAVIQVGQLTAAEKEHGAGLDVVKAKYADFTSAMNGLQAQLDKLTGDDGGFSHANKALMDIMAAEAAGKTVIQAQADAYYELSVKLDVAIAAHKRWNEVMKVALDAAKDEQKALDDWNKAIIAGLKSYTDFYAAVQNGIQKSNDEVDALGMSATALRDLNAVREIDRKTQQELLKLGADGLEDTRAQVVALGEEAKAIVLANNAKIDSINAWRHVLDSATTGVSNFIVDFVEHGSAAFKNLWDNFKKWALQALAEIAAKQIVVSIVGALGLGGSAGASAASGIASSVSGGGGILDTISSGAGQLYGAATGTTAGSTAANAIASIAGPSTFTANLAGDAFLPGALAGTEGLAGTAAAAGGGLAAAGSAAAAAIPFVGIALAAYAAYKYFSKKGGGPMTGGFSSSGDIGAFNFDGGIGLRNNTELNTVTAPAAQEAQSTYQALLKALGGTGSAGFAFGASADPQGTAQSNARAAAIVDGRTVFESPDVQKAGRTDASLAAAMTLEANKAILAALQASSLPDVVAGYLKSIDVSTATVQQITDALNHAKDLKVLVDQVGALPKSLADGLLAAMAKAPQLDAQIQAFAAAFGAFSAAAGKLNEVLARDPRAEALTALAGAQDSAYGKVLTLRTGLEGLVGSFDGSTVATEALATATGAYVDAQAQALQQIEQLKAGLTGMFGDSIKQLDFAVLDTAQRGAFLQDEAAKTMQLLKTATDPTAIEKFSKLIDKDLVDAFNLLSPDQQKAQHDEFVKNLQAANDTTLAQLAASGDAITQENQGNQSIMSVIRDAMGAAAAKQTEAAEKLIAAANAMQAAANGQQQAANISQEAAGLNVAAAQGQLQAATTPIDINVNVVGNNDTGSGP